MKIIKLSDEYDMKKYNEEKAKAECDVCPCCGESEKYFTTAKLIKGLQTNDYSDLYKGIEDLGKYRVCNKKFIQIFNKSKFVISRYKCHTCGTRWESEPYDM
jgi:hypothetical protein